MEYEFRHKEVSNTAISETIEIVYNGKVYGEWEKDANIDYPEDLTLSRDLSELIEIGIKIGKQIERDVTWTPIEDSLLIKDEIINFIERSNGDGLHAPTQTVHKGWMENKTQFYSECADKYIEASKVTHILKIPAVP